MNARPLLNLAMIIGLLLPTWLTAGSAPAQAAPESEHGLPAGSIGPGRESNNTNSSKPDTLLQFTTGGHVAGFRTGEMYLAAVDHMLKVEFIDAQAVAPTHDEQSLPTVETRPGAPPLKAVTYPDLWDRVTLVYEQRAGTVIKSTYYIAPKISNPQSPISNPVDQIRLRYNVPVRLGDGGDLLLSFEMGQLKESAPVAWQEIGGRRVPVQVAFRLLGEREVGFAMGAYDPARPLVIDPELTWNTFLGGTNSKDKGKAIAMGGNGDVYVAGITGASWGTPLNPFTGGTDAFVANLGPDGYLQWHTFIGGAGDDDGKAIAVDGNGDIYVAGTAGATWGAPVNPLAGGSDAFAAKLNSSGELLWHTFIGSANTDDGKAIAVDGAGNVYTAGDSDTPWGTPVNPHAGAGQVDAFLAQLDSSGARQWHTFLGSATWDEARAIAVDGNGNLYVAGGSDATWGAPINSHAGGSADAFVAQLNSSGIVQWNTFLGGTDTDYGNGIAVDGAGGVYVAGSSDGAWGSPVNPYAGGWDAFVAKLNSSGALQWNTFLGSGDLDEGNAIAVDSNGDAYVAGTAGATWGTPIDSDAGAHDAFAAKLDDSGALQWHTFMGSALDDAGNAIAAYSDWDVYVAGTSAAPWNRLPVDHSMSGDGTFVAQLNSSGGWHWHAFPGPRDYDTSNAIAVDKNGNVYVAGWSEATWGEPLNSFTGGSYNAFAAKLNSSGVLQWNTFLGWSGDSTIAVDGDGEVYVAGTAGAAWGTPVNPFAGGSDAFVAKLSSNGELLWHTFMGSGTSDNGSAIAVDRDRNVYIAGDSNTPWGTPILPHAGAAQVDAFAAKLDSNGVRQWHTFLGTTFWDEGRAVAVDANGDVYVAGGSSITWGAPINPHAGGGQPDAFVAKLNSSGNLLWHTFLGGTGGEDYSNAVAVDGSGNVYVAGPSGASWGTPVNPHAGSWDVFAAKLHSSGLLQWNTFLGSAGFDDGKAIAVDEAGVVYVTGESYAAWGAPAYPYAGGHDAFAAKLDTNGALQWHTFLGSAADDSGNAIAVDGSFVYVAGTSNATWGTPVNPHAGGDDAFVAKVGWPQVYLPIVACND